MHDQQPLPTRDCTVNAGFVSLYDIPTDETIAGVIVVTLKPDGEYRTHFVAESLDDVPTPEVQEDLGRLVAHAWETANLSGLTLD